MFCLQNVALRMSHAHRHNEPTIMQYLGCVLFWYVHRIEHFSTFSGKLEYAAINL